MDKLLDNRVNEEARLNALRNLNLLDSAPSDSFDRLIPKLSDHDLCRAGRIHAGPYR